MSRPPLSPQDDEAVLRAHRALVRSLDRQYPPRLAQVLVCTAIARGFVLTCKASTGRADLIEVINRELAEDGLRLVPTARN